jgi:hypothetical protein
MRAPVMIVLAFGLAFPVLAFAEDPPKVSNSGRVEGRFCPTPGVQSCPKSCANWANSQTDYQYSYNACVAMCRKQFQC